MLNFLTNKIKLHNLRKKWKKLNLYNDTLPMNLFDIDSVRVGKYSYGELNVYNFNIGEKVFVGSFCSIASNVMFILNADHDMKNLSTFPFRVRITENSKFEAVSKGNIIIDDDVWIGYGATILSGVHIGRGAIVAAGAVVSKDIPPYAIVGGVPAKTIKKRFSDATIDYLMTLDYSRLDEDMIKSHIDDLYIDISNMDTDSIERLYEWFPKKNI